MDEMFCPGCRLKQPTDHTYCIACGVQLPTHLLGDLTPNKVARFFAGIKVGNDDPETGFLKVSCYLKDHTIKTWEGSVSIPGNHVRVSMWVDDESRCVMSLPASEAREMAGFILGQVAAQQPAPSI
ncbi:MAG: hypothetical protein ACR2L3_02455 [Actinomycetota bacterium]